MNTVNVTESNHFIRLNIEMPTQVYSTHAITIFDAFSSESSVKAKQ